MAHEPTDQDKDDAIKELVKEFEAKGIGVRSVSDGHIIMFKRQYLQALLDKMPDKKEFAIFLRKPDLN
jgi:hypothetical protein